MRLNRMPYSVDLELLRQGINEIDDPKVKSILFAFLHEAEDTRALLENLVRFVELAAEMAMNQ